MEQRTLTLQAPAIHSDITVIFNRFVAGNRDREPIGQAGQGDRGSLPRRTDALCDFGVRGGSSGPDGSERPPYFQLEGRADDVERKAEIEPRRLDAFDDLGADAFQAVVSTENLSSGVVVMKSAQDGA